MRAVCIFIFDAQEEQILVTLRKEGGYGLVGGKVEVGESDITAILRETREETGLVQRPSTIRLQLEMSPSTEVNQTPKGPFTTQYFFSEGSNWKIDPDVEPDCETVWMDVRAYLAQSHWNAADNRQWHQLYTQWRRRALGEKMVEVLV